MNIDRITDKQITALKNLRFGPPVTHVYNPLEYARISHDIYLHRYAGSVKEAVFLGMNPGPWGMAQTGVPFGEIRAVREWMGIDAPVGTPEMMHPKRMVEGFSCRKSEVSGRRLWGWAEKRFGTPERFFNRFFVANYCPLVFMEESGKNRTPDKLKKAEKAPLFEICNQVLRELMGFLRPRYLIGVGVFAEKQALSALDGLDIQVGRIAHPSPANPNANKGWEALVERELSDLGITV